MVETYSLGATGTRADRPLAANTLEVGDSAGLAGSQQLAMRTGAQVLCQNPDGSQSYYTFDAERSLPGGPVVMKRV